MENVERAKALAELQREERRRLQREVDRLRMADDSALLEEMRYLRGEPGSRSMTGEPLELTPRAFMGLLARHWPSSGEMLEFMERWEARRAKKIAESFGGSGSERDAPGGGNVPKHLG